MAFGLSRSADVFVEPKVPREQPLIRLATRMNGRQPAIACTVAAVAHQGNERMERRGRAVRTTRAARSMTCGRLYFCDVLLERLAQGLDDMTAKLRGRHRLTDRLFCLGGFSGLWLWTGQR